MGLSHSTVPATLALEVKENGAFAARGSIPLFADWIRRVQLWRGRRARSFSCMHSEPDFADWAK